MANVTANVRIAGRPLRRAFVEHTGPAGFGSLGWDLTDENGSFTFDAGLLADKVDIKVHCHNSVLRVLDGGLPVPTPVHQVIGGVANGDTKEIPHQRDFYRIMSTSLDVYDTVWRQFRPFNRDDRADFRWVANQPCWIPSNTPTGSNSATPTPSPAPLAWVEPAALNNGNFPLVHIKHRDSDGRLFGEGDALASITIRRSSRTNWATPSTSPSRLRPPGNRWRPSTREFVLTHLSDPTHTIATRTTPFVAFIEAVGIFSERFFFFRQTRRATAERRGCAARVLPGRIARPAAAERIDRQLMFTVGTQSGTVVTPALRGSDREGLRVRRDLPGISPGGSGSARQSDSCWTATPQPSPSSCSTSKAAATKAGGSPSVPWQTPGACEPRLPSARRYLRGRRAVLGWLVASFGGQ